MKLFNDALDESSEARRKREAAEGEAPRGASDDDTETVNDEETSPLHEEEEPQDVVAVAKTLQELLDNCSLTDTRTSNGFEVYVSDTKIRQFKVSQQKQRTLMRVVDKAIDIVFEECDNSLRLESVSEDYIIHLKAQCKDLFRRMRNIFVILNKKEDFSDSEIEETQSELDKFCSRHRQIFTASQVTNYLHYFESGHLRYFLYRYRNLYRNSSVGVEANMRVVKNVYNHKIKCGTDPSKVIGQFMLRRCVLLANELNPTLALVADLTQKYIQQKPQKKKTGPKPRVVAPSVPAI